MLAHTPATVLLALPLFAAVAGACPTGKVLLCCAQFKSTSNSAALEFLGILGIEASGRVGIDCTPIDDSSVSCDQSSLCCSNNHVCMFACMYKRSADLFS
ncbi:hypothetical protein DXG01_004937 [Tephrocybe rancida]|nr:hypothetical protein DXG01_004937 [Tephrocybe rancida]